MENVNSKIQDHSSSVNKTETEEKVSRLEEINDFIDHSLLLAVICMSFMVYLYLGAYEVGPQMSFTWASFGFYMCVFLITAAVAAIMNVVFKILLVIAILLLPFYIYMKANPEPEKPTMGQIKSMK